MLHTKKHNFAAKIGSKTRILLLPISHIRDICASNLIPPHLLLFTDVAAHSEAKGKTKTRKRRQTFSSSSRVLLRPRVGFFWGELETEAWRGAAGPPLRSSWRCQMRHPSPALRTNPNTAATPRAFFKLFLLTDKLFTTEHSDVNTTDFATWSVYMKCSRHLVIFFFSSQQKCDANDKLSSKKSIRKNRHAYKNIKILCIKSALVIKLQNIHSSD